MKKTLLTLIGVFCLSYTFAQTEINLALNSGLFSYRGSSAEKTSFMNHVSSNVNNTYTNSIFGAKNAISYGLSVNLKQLLFKNRFILGLDVGVERLRSKVSIDRISGYNVSITPSNYNYSASGESFLNTDFINLHPNIGYRMHANQVKFDLTAGFDVGFITKATEKGSAVDKNGTTYTSLQDRKGLKTDLRARFELAATYKKAGIYAGYAHGLSNYMNGWIGGSPEATSKFIRFGLTYRIL